MPGWPGGLGNRLQDLRTLIDQGLGDRLQAMQEHRAALERGRIAQAFGAASEGQQEPSEELYAAKHRRAQGLPPETSFLQDVASLGPRALGGAQKMWQAAPMAAEALYNDPLGSINSAGMAGQAATDAIVQGMARPFTQFGDPNVDPAQQGADLALAAMGGSAAIPKPASSLGVFGGRAAKTANIEKLTRASDMANGGFTPEEIWKETGWFKGADDKWRFEIPDQPAKFVKGKSKPLGRLELANKRLKEQTGGKGLFANPAWGKETDEALAWVDANKHLAQEAPTDPLGEVLVHPDLYAAYPEMANYPTMPERLNYTELEGSFTPRTKKITYGGSEMLGRSPDNRSTLLHEAQHAIQQREGFAKGGSPEDFGGLGGYRRLGGEVEARNVQTRRNMTTTERAATPPWWTQDVPTEQQHLHYDFSGPQASIRAYHGSPHDFDEFSMDHSRAGNYGDAAYFHTAKEDADRYNFRPHGKTYEADLNLNRTFDMKKEISADDAAAILEGIGNKEMADQVRKSGRGFRTGSELWYWGMGQSMPSWQKAKAVKNAGFDSIIGDPGQEIAGKSTRSPEIAVFDDKLISILRKYGLPISAAGLAALSQLHPQEAQAAPLGDRLQRGK